MLGATTKGVALPGRAELSRTTWDSGSGVAKQNFASAASEVEPPAQLRLLVSQGTPLRAALPAHSRAGSSHWMSQQSELQQGLQVTFCVQPSH